MKKIIIILIIFGLLIGACFGLLRKLPEKDTDVTTTVDGSGGAVITDPTVTTAPVTEYVSKGDNDLTGKTPLELAVYDGYNHATGYYVVGDTTYFGTLFTSTEVLDGVYVWNYSEAYISTDGINFTTVTEKSEDTMSFVITSSQQGKNNETGYYYVFAAYEIVENCEDPQSYWESSNLFLFTETPGLEGPSVE